MGSFVLLKPLRDITICQRNLLKLLRRNSPASPYVSTYKSSGHARTPKTAAKATGINSDGREAIFRNSNHSIRTLESLKCYHKSTSPLENNAFSVDLRSDTVTKPTAEMREAMKNASVGDDVMMEDPTVFALETEAAQLFKMEAALFVPSGTMGNLVSILSHCNRGDEILLGDLSHIFLYEQAGAAQFAGVSPYPLATTRNGTFDLHELERRIRPDDPHCPITKMVCVENANTARGGLALPVDYIQELRNFCDEHNLILHMDGARLMNSVTYLGCQPSDVLQHVHSVSVCLSKSLGAPVGSIVAGTAQFINRARRARKALGGSMRQSGVLAACGLIALDKGSKRLHEDHENAMLIAQTIDDVKSPVLNVDLEYQQTNLVNLYRHKSPGYKDVSMDDVTSRLIEVTEEELDVLGEQTSVHIQEGATPDYIRLTTHSGVTRDDCVRAARKVAFVVKQMTSELQV